MKRSWWGATRTSPATMPGQPLQRLATRQTGPVSAESGGAESDQK